MNTKEYEELVESKRLEFQDEAKNAAWLKKELLERVRINVGLIAQNSEWQRKMAVAQRGCSYTELNGERCGEFVGNPFCDRHKPE